MNDKIIITDIGSTTTKAIYLSKENKGLKLQGLSNSITTVESPYEDVKIGVFQALTELERVTGEKFLTPDSKEDNLQFLPDISYLTTSSAGGGLQILVVGLTLFDSAKSAERAAFGAGGVLLNTLAINDLRTTYEQLQLINNSHPDIILFSGGTDGGAFTGVIRLAEILSLGVPSPKFVTDHKIPLIFAGNIEAQDFMRTLFANNYDLSILPNIRPTMEKEFLEPITDKIHELFLNSVMENAPGYAQLKHIVDGDILPTPLSVLKVMELLKTKYSSSILKVDIGGATTDIFSVINSRLYRTVSANYGMSYSISNVIANAGYSSLEELLPAEFKENLIRDYIGNKMLNPGYVPNTDVEIAIEQAVAILALRLSLEQHYEMHLNTTKLGFLEDVKSRFRDPFYDQMYQEKVAEAKKFHHSDIEIVIGAGGVISHAKKTLQALYIIMQGFQVEGITQVWRDKHFISPHLGALCEYEQEETYKLLMSECYENLGTVINPFTVTKNERKVVLTVEVGTEIYNFMLNEIKYIEIKKSTKVTVKLTKYALIKDVEEKTSFDTDKPLIITTYPNKKIDNKKLIKTLGLYNLDNNLLFNEIASYNTKNINKNYYKTSGKFTKEIKLPYPGDILVNAGDKLNPDSIYGVNNHQFPKIYIISLAKLLGSNFGKIDIKENILVGVGDVLKYDKQIIDIAYSPIRGIIKMINYETGTIIVRELQDYHERAMTVQVAKLINKRPSTLRSLLKVNLGDFVFEDESLVHLTRDGIAKIVRAPNTGYITDIDYKKGSVTIQYIRKPINYPSQLNCQVTDVETSKSIKVEYEATEYQGVIGFGKNNFGELIYLKNINDSALLSEKIIVLDNLVSFDDLSFLEKQNISGLIIAGIEMSDITKFIGKEIGVALTGNEGIPYPIIVMNGFGEFKLDSDFVNVVKDNSGHNCLLSPATQIRAGVTRPKVIIN